LVNGRLYNPLLSLRRVFFALLASPSLVKSTRDASGQQNTLKRPR
jgi:hypothetical protein